MNLILIAPPAAGKGTLASMLNEKYGYVCISAGELLRGVDPSTELGRHIRDLQSRRELVSDTITNKLMKERLMKDDIKNGFILDGYPRLMPQVEALEDMCKELNLKIDYAVLLNIKYETGLKRTIGRYICPNCKKTYNVLTGVNVPKLDNMCDECNVSLTRRNDDNEEAYKLGYETYLRNCTSVIDYYKNLGKLIEVDAEGSADNTLKEFENIIKEVKND